MTPRSSGFDLQRLGRSARRLASHGRRAVGAVARLGPGRYPGMVVAVDVGTDGIAVRGDVAGAATTATHVLVRVAGDPVGVAPVSDRAWVLHLDPGRLPAGEVHVDAEALLPSGLIEPLGAGTFTIGPMPPAHQDRAPVGDVDQPLAGATAVGGVIEVHGWVAPALGVDRVEVTLDGGVPEPARLFCAPRHDAVVQCGDATAVMAGFWHLVEVGERPPGTGATLHVDVIGPAGRQRIASRPVALGPVDARVDDDARRWVAALAARAELAAAELVPDAGVHLLVRTHHLGLGGAQLWLHEVLVPLLDQADVACTVVAPEDGPLRAELERLGARVHLIGPPPRDAGSYESRQRELAQLVAAEGCNVVLANTVAAFDAVDVAGRCDLPAVWAIHDHLSELAFWRTVGGAAPLDAHLRERRAAALAGAAAVCFVAEATRALYAPPPDAARPGDDDRFVVVPYGIDLAAVDRQRAGLDRDALRAAHGFAPDDRVIVCVATLDARKSQSNLVLAFARTVAARPAAQPAAHLVLVGADDGPYAVGVRRLVETLGLQHRIRVVALTEDVAPWYAMADGFALSSDAESLPRSIIEAMAWRIPVLASDVGGVRELVTPGETGLVAPPRDIGALADALDALLGLTGAERAAMVDRAEAAVRPAYDVGAYTSAFGRLLRGLAKDADASPRALLAPPVGGVG